LVAPERGAVQLTTHRLGGTGPALKAAPSANDLINVVGVSMFYICDLPVPKLSAAQKKKLAGSAA